MKNINQIIKITGTDLPRWLFQEKSHEFRVKGEKLIETIYGIPKEGFPPTYVEKQEGVETLERLALT